MKGEVREYQTIPVNRRVTTTTAMIPTTVPAMQPERQLPHISDSPGQVYLPGDIIPSNVSLDRKGISCDHLGLKG